MNIIREGPKHLIIQSHDVSHSFEMLKGMLSYDITITKSDHMYEDYLNMISFLDDTQTVLMFTGKMLDKLSFKYNDFVYCSVVPKSLGQILMTIINDYDALKISKVRTAPKMVIMRTVGQIDDYIKGVNLDIKGQMLPMIDVFESYGQGTIILFTEKSLQCPLGINDFHSQVLYTKRGTTKLVKFLNNRVVKYINFGIGKKDWTEVIIKIYDAYEQYGLHYERLTSMLNELDCGLILGEDWATDAAMAFRSVDVYQVRLFTYLDPVEIKKHALALEYDTYGHRVADIDVYFKKKKISWSQTRVSDYKYRDELGSYYRKKMEQNVHDDVLVSLLALEKQIDKRNV